MTNPGNDLIRSTRSSSSAESTEICAQCGHLVPESSKFCPGCGARVPLLRTGEVFEDKYEVVRLMAQGTTTELYEVRHIELGEPRSLKILRPELFLEENHRLRFRREAKLASRVRHSNVTELYDFVAMKDGGYYMVSEYLDGRPLRQWHEANDADVRAVVDIGIQVLNGLGAIHSAGIVHRDISPETILIADAPGATREGATVRAKIADLGIAKGLEPISEDAATEAGRFMGNVQYSSPEQAGMSDELLDGRSDLYSLGVTVYEMLSGELPFRALTPQGYLERHVSSAPRSLRDAAPDKDFPASLDVVISKAIEKEREKRFQSAAEFRDALLEARKDLSAVQPTRSSKPALAAELPATAVAPVSVPAPVAAKPVSPPSPERQTSVVPDRDEGNASEFTEPVAPAIPEVGDLPAGVSDRDVTLPDGVQQPGDVAPPSGTEREGFATTPLAASAATRDVSAGNTYDPLARKKIQWGTWLLVALLAALVLWGIWIMTRPAPEIETGTLAITATSSDTPTETVAEGAATTKTAPLATLPPNIVDPVGDGSILQDAPDPAGTADLTAQPAQVPATPPQSEDVGETRFPNPQVSERQAINIIITGVNRTNYYGVEARCVGVGSSRYVNGGYTIELIARSCPGVEAPGKLLGRWRVDGRTGDAYVQNSSGKYVTP